MKIFTCVVILIFSVSSSCTNPFSVREPEKPEANTNSDLYEQPTSYEIVLTNLRYAVIQKNLTNYKNCFVSSDNSNIFNYRFIPDTRIEKSLFFGWTLDDEINYFRKLTSDSEIRSISLNDFGLDAVDFSIITNNRDSVQTDIFNYDLEISYPDTVISFKGQAKMKLVKNENSLWAIYYWEDRPADDSWPSSWSSLKLLY